MTLYIYNPCTTSTVQAVGGYFFPFSGVGGIAHLLFLTLCSPCKHYLPTFFSLHQSKHLDPLFGFLGCTWANIYIYIYIYWFPYQHTFSILFYFLPHPNKYPNLLFRFKVVHEPKKSQMFQFFLAIFLSTFSYYYYVFIFPPTNEHLDHGFWVYMDPK